MRRTLTDVVKSYAVSATTLLIYIKFVTIGGHWQVKTAKHRFFVNLGAANLS